jgi:molybdate transport system regulatory protein
MTQHPSRVTDTDVALLRCIGRERSVVAASRAVGISRDRAVYRLDRLERAFGGPVVASARGGRSHGGTVLTPLGDRIVRGGFDAVEMIDARSLVDAPRPNLVRGVYRAGPPPEVEVARGVRLRVVFAAEDGERVGVALDPEAIVVARRRFPSSARNVLAGTVARLERPPGGLDRCLVVRVGPLALRVSVTAETVEQLDLRRGARVVLYVKATALRRVARGR